MSALDFLVLVQTGATIVFALAAIWFARNVIEMGRIVANQARELYLLRERVRRLEKWMQMD